MAERKVLSIDVFEVPDTGAGKDYRVFMTGNHGGLTMKYETTINDVREFFTEFKHKNDKSLKEVEDEKGQAKLISLPNPEGAEES